MKNVITILFLLIGGYSFAQKVKVSNLNLAFQKVRNVQRFLPVHDQFPDDSLDYVGDFTVEFDTLYHETIKSLFLALKEKANRLGANSFRVKKADIYTTTEEKYITLECYFLKWEDMPRNKELYYSNQVYLFGYTSHHQNIDGYKVKYNNKDFTLYELRYKAFNPAIGDKIQVELGSGVRGAKYSFVIEERMTPHYLYFTMVSGTFYNCLIQEYDYSYGEFLKGILREE